MRGFVILVFGFVWNLEFWIWNLNPPILQQALHKASIPVRNVSSIIMLYSVPYMPFAPERLGPDVRRRLERAFCTCVLLLTTMGLMTPVGPAYALVDDLKNYAIFL